MMTAFITTKYPILMDKGFWAMAHEYRTDFADVSASGELGYTYGKYTYTSTDSLGHTTQSGGIFHTVWKRQPDGQWRFVWD